MSGLLERIDPPVTERSDADNPGDSYFFSNAPLEIGAGDRKFGIGDVRVELADFVHVLRTIPGAYVNAPLLTNSQLWMSLGEFVPDDSVVR